MDSHDKTRRIFSRAIKEQCWEKAFKVPGRHPDRWRFDAVGNIVCKRLCNCDGCMCYEYDHVVPFSKGGLSSLENCQILQTRVNRLKSNQQNDSLVHLQSYSCLLLRPSNTELDFMEMALYGSILHPDHSGCRIISHFENSMHQIRKHGYADHKLPPCSLYESH